ncbi:MAG: hypothetical protein ACKO9Q_01475, partial [Pirellula sp.]
MCRLAVERLEHVHVFTYEQENEYSSDGYHLVKRLLGETSFRDRIEFCLILERSLADEMHRSTTTERIEDAIPILIIDSKPPIPAPESAWFRNPPHRWVQVESSLENITTQTAIRGLLEKQDNTVWRYLPPEIAEYIRKESLYRKPIDSDAIQIPKLKIAVFSDSFSPPTLHQRTQVEKLLEQGFDKVIIHPRGVRADRGEHEVALPRHRAALVSLAFKDIPNVEVNYEDISNGTNSPLIDLTYKYESQGEVWLVVPQADATKATSGRPSAIENYEQGQRLWQEARFAVLV